MFDFQENAANLAAEVPISHGPRNMIARFIEQSERRGAEIGVKFAFEHDFHGLLRVHRESQKSGALLTPMFNPECGYDGNNGWWISARNEAGELVANIAARVYEWETTNLADELESFRFFYRDVAAFRLPEERCEVSATMARKISGRVFYGGSQWIRPDMRSKGLSAIMPRLSKAYGLARYNFEWAFAMVEPILVRKGVAKRYGFSQIDFGVHLVGSRFGDHDLTLCWLTRDEFIDDLAAVERTPALLEG